MTATQASSPGFPETGFSLKAPEALQAVPARPKKKLIRRRGHDYSVIYRRSFQGTFLLLNLWIGTRFYSWVRQFGVGPAASLVKRPAGVEGWLPIAGLMNLKYWLVSGEIPRVHPAAMFLLLAFLAIAFLFRKAFCSWLCPIGTISEYLWRAGKKIFDRSFFLPRWLDLPLRGLKYFLLGFLLWAVSTMSAAGIHDFMTTPYGLIADVKNAELFSSYWRKRADRNRLIRFGFAVRSDFWCRFLCPYGALLGLTSWFSPMKIRRDPEPCIDCAKMR